MKRKHLSFLITEKDEEFAKKITENDPQYRSMPLIVSKAVKDFLIRYKDNEPSKWWEDEELKK